MSAARTVGSMLPRSTSSGLYAFGILFKQKNKHILPFKAEQKGLQIQLYAAAVTDKVREKGKRKAIEMLVQGKCIFSKPKLIRSL